ncbi:BolA family transcriptional regulator [Candidatus Methylospira mobilis]|uniref:BolA family transcriptional regulator n=1 Tax=Candidatus Methylospira mobilis TaxID=1808979 RepID=A0A5Q0BID2_9GAMM|nr:BolA family protein [Candidatus Methylospira mobilis]QFY43583.1 BolA family transcriptional regulator [Candidatus Methylospira mobilis]WNV03875.1 BolA family protein [Candidatus Methylospira mobilis]
MTTRVDKIKQLLQQHLQPAFLDIQDDSARHAGHAGVREAGGGHFYATIVSSAFEGSNAVQRHRNVYQILAEMMPAEIHALSIKAYTPSEYKQQEL